MLSGDGHHNEEPVLDIRSDGNGNDYEEWRAEEMYDYCRSRDLEGMIVDAGAVFGPKTGDEHEVYEMRKM